MQNTPFKKSYATGNNTSGGKSKSSRLSNKNPNKNEDFKSVAKKV